MTLDLVGVGCVQSYELARAAQLKGKEDRVGADRLRGRIGVGEHGRSPVSARGEDHQTSPARPSGAHEIFIIAVETTANGRPLYARLQVVRGFQTAEVKRLCARVEAGTTVVSDGGQWFQCIAWQPGIIHERHVTGSGRTAARHPAFRWANTVLANVKNSLLATHRAVAAKHLPRYLGAFAWRFNRRFVLKTVYERLAIAAAATPPMPYRLLKLAEARW